MEQFIAVAPEQLEENFFQAIGKDWMLITVQRGEKVNPMTASWGGAGILWAKPVVFVFLRPHRLTREMLDDVDGFSLNFFGEGYRKQLNHCGTRSGRDTDKVADCGFDVAHDGAVPYLAQSRLAIVCHKLYRQPLQPEFFLDTSLDQIHYPKRDHHILYVGAIDKVLIKQA